MLYLKVIHVATSAKKVRLRVVPLSLSPSCVIQRQTIDLRTRLFGLWSLVLSLDCEQSLYFPSVFRAIERTSRERTSGEWWAASREPARSHSLLVSFPNLHNINKVPHAKDFRNKNRLLVVYTEVYCLRLNFWCGESVASVAAVHNCCISEWAWGERARQLSNQQKITLWGLAISFSH